VRTALVTGASSGVGRATVAALVRDGFRVLGVARREQRLAELARETGADVLACALDTPEGCARAVAEAGRRLGGVNVLVSNAGIDTNRERPIWEQDPAVWRETFAINLDASFELCRALTKHMVEQRWGRIVIVSSTAGELGAPASSAYCASKHAVLGLMRSVAADVAPYGVTCNAVLPGWVRGTEMSDRTMALEAERRGISADEVWEEIEHGQVAGRVVRPEEVAETIAFLAGESSSGINGEAVRIALGSAW
jgi:NAD(P)-dependent dehydrogenase (short-subunit alcohol dehydrogenase family)